MPPRPSGDQPADPGPGGHLQLPQVAAQGPLATRYPPPLGSHCVVAYFSSLLIRPNPKKGSEKGCHEGRSFESQGREGFGGLPEAGLIYEVKTLRIFKSPAAAISGGSPLHADSYNVGKSQVQAANHTFFGAESREGVHWPPATMNRQRLSKSPR